MTEGFLVTLTFSGLSVAQRGFLVRVEVAKWFLVTLTFSGLSVAQRGSRGAPGRALCWQSRPFFPCLSSCRPFFPCLSSGRSRGSMGLKVSSLG